jgi:hypothetical protein
MGGQSFIKSYLGSLLNATNLSDDRVWEKIIAELSAGDFPEHALKPKTW